MKYFLIIISITFCVFYSATACDSNWTVTGKNGYKFCISPKDRKMNWWSAHQWCQSQGYKLATPDQACTTDDGYTWDTTETKCQLGNIGLGDPWLNLYKNGLALHIVWNGLKTGYDNAASFNTNAICVMND